MLLAADRLFRRFQKTGDPRLLGQVFDRTAPELLRVALHLSRDRHRAEDLLQSTFLTAIEKAAQYDAERRVLPWLLAILANHARQAHRRDRRPLPDAPVAGTTGDVGDQVAARELAEACDRAVDALAARRCASSSARLVSRCADVSSTNRAGRPRVRSCSSVSTSTPLIRRS